MIERNVTCKTKPVSRGRGHTAVAGAAYRAGENLKARGLGPDGAEKLYRYSNRQHTVREAFIMAPENAPEYATDRAELWNRVEEMETRKNARLGREIQLGFAYELPKAQQRELLVQFVEGEFVARGFVADVAIYDYGKTLPAMGGSEIQQARVRELAVSGIPFLERDEAKASDDVHVMVSRNRAGDVTGYQLYQPHAHVRITPRSVEGGEWVENKKASRFFNRHETAMNWRYEWPKLQNAYLERIGAEVRVTSTSADEDSFPGVPRRGTGGNEVTHAIEERASDLAPEALAKHEEAKSREAIEQEFREVHNETLRQAFKDEHADTTQAEGDEREARRLSAWWRNMSERYNEWRFDFEEKASQWGERFRQQKSRMKAVLGWSFEEPSEEDTDKDKPPAPRSGVSSVEISPRERDAPDDPEQER